MLWFKFFFGLKILNQLLILFTFLTNEGYGNESETKEIKIIKLVLNFQTNNNIIISLKN